MNEEEIDTQYKELDDKLLNSARKFVKFSQEYNDLSFFNCAGS